MIKFSDKPTAVSMRFLVHTFVRVILIVTFLFKISLVHAGPITYQFTKIADTKGDRFIGFGATPSINNSGAVAFSGALVGESFAGIYVGNGGPTTTILDNSYNLGATTQAPSINDAGAVAFVAQALASSELGGIFVGSGGPLTSISYEFSGTPEINNNGVVAFVTLNGGTVDAFKGSGGPLTAFFRDNRLEVRLQ